MKTFPAYMRWFGFVAALLGLSTLNTAQAQTELDLTPPEMRGIWYPEGDLGQRQCAKVRRDGADELHAGALQIAHTQLVDWRAGGQNTVVFVTEVRPRRHLIWRLQGLEDVYPYEALKTLRTYIFVLTKTKTKTKTKNELRWSKRSFDGVTEHVSTRVYWRCL